MTKREKNRGIKLGTKERTNRTKGREERKRDKREDKYIYKNEEGNGREWNGTE